MERLDAHSGRSGHIEHIASIIGARFANRENTGANSCAITVPAFIIERPILLVVRSNAESLSVDFLTASSTIRLILSVADKMNANFRVLFAMCRYRFSMPDSTTRRGVVISFS